jgi:hypothetical protein
MRNSGHPDLIWNESFIPNVVSIRAKIPIIKWAVIGDINEEKADIKSDVVTPTYK